MIFQYLAGIADVRVDAVLPGDTSFTTSVTSPTDAICGVQVNSDGNFDVRGGASPSAYAYYSTWLTGAGTNADYQCRATVVSGTVTGTTGSWLSCSSARAWAVSRTNNLAGTDTAVISVEIRSALDGRVLDSGTFTLNATVT